MFVKPAQPELLVPVPDAPPHERWLQPEGREVPDTLYWRRRLGDGDVVEATPPPEPQPEPQPDLKPEESGAARRRKE
jgi:hypothetical protein